MNQVILALPLMVSNRSLACSSLVRHLSRTGQRDLPSAIHQRAPVRFKHRSVSMHQLVALVADAALNRTRLPVPRVRRGSCVGMDKA
jgi:predicted ATPase with chaperone activity